MVREIGYFCRRLLTHGFVCRGAITVGHIYHRGRFVVGPAFVDAYRLEQSVALYPRVVLDSAALDVWTDEFRADEYGKRGPHPHFEALVKRDRDATEAIAFTDQRRHNCDARLIWRKFESPSPKM